MHRCNNYSAQHVKLSGRGKVELNSKTELTARIMSVPAQHWGQTGCMGNQEEREGDQEWERWITTSEGQAEASGYYFIHSKAPVKVRRQGSRDQVITSSYVGRMGRGRLDAGEH